MRRCKFLPFANLTLLLAAIFFLPASQLQAGASNKSGNPYGNGTFFPDGGSYTAVVRGANGFLGSMQITTSSSTTATNLTATNSGIATIYAYGEQFTGNAFGVVSGSTIAVTYNGYYPLNLYATVETPATLNAPATYDTKVYSVSNTVSGQFSATLQNSYPNQVFSGTGQANATLYILTNAVNNPLVQVVTTINVSYSTDAEGSRLQ